MYRIGAQEKVNTTYSQQFTADPSTLRKFQLIWMQHIYHLTIRYNDFFLLQAEIIQWIWHRFEESCGKIIGIL